MFRAKCAATAVFVAFISMPLLTELVLSEDGFGYRHGAPNGAVPRSQRPFPPKTAKERLSAIRFGHQRYGAVGLPGIGGGWALEVLMPLKEQTRGPVQAAAFVRERRKAFYGTRVCPERCQGSAGVARGCKPPFSVVRMLMQAAPGRTQSAGCGVGSSRGKPPKATSMRHQSHLKAI
jgi:hypothetical protein